MSTVESSGLIHDAFVYASDEEFLAGTLPFLDEGIELGEPILAAPTHANAELLRGKLRRRAKGVDWAENAGAHRAVERLGIFLDYIGEHVSRGATRIRLLGEPCWPPEGEPGTGEWKRYESFLNVALADHPVWLVCPYDRSRLAPDIVEDAHLTHPNFGHGESRTASADYLDPAAFARRIDDVPLPRAPEDASERYFGNAGAVRRFVVTEARAAGLAAERVNDAELAAGEVAANVFRHAADVARVRAWVASGSFVCDIDDTGRGIADPFAGYGIAERTALGGRGLTIARRLADVVEIRTTSTGALVRLHFRRGEQAV
jgi:anti-sigma regulatory factor (Ser/Thr protein kinase)